MFQFSLFISHSKNGFFFFKFYRRLRPNIYYNIVIHSNTSAPTASAIVYKVSFGVALMRVQSELGHWTQNFGGLNSKF
jgi:hypothetical protein